MMFWDSSAIIPLCIEERQTKAVRNIARKDGAMAAWWGSIIECYSAFARLSRENFLKPAQEDIVRQALALLLTSWTEIEPGQDIRDIAERLLFLHPLHFADSLQLAAALVWSGNIPKGHRFVCLDNRLREAAKKEGFTLLPPEL